MKAVVLAGGLSPGRNVSLSTGAMVAEAPWTLGYRTDLIDLYFGLETGGADEAFPDASVFEAYKEISREVPGLDQVRCDRKEDSPSMFGPGVPELCQMADMVFLALHGTCGEDGRVQAAFDLVEIPYTDTGYLSSAIAMDKSLTKRMVVNAVFTPGWKTVTYTAADTDRLIEAVRLPLVVKPMASGSSISVSVAHTAEGLRRSLTGGPVLEGYTVLGECIRGREIQVGILKDKALPPIEIIPEQGFCDHTSKYQSGVALEVCPTEITPEEEARVRATTLQVRETLGLSVCSCTDFIPTEDGEPWFLEINTLPGMTPTNLLPQEATAAGIGYNELCQHTAHTFLETQKQGR